MQYLAYSSKKVVHAWSTGAVIIHNVFQDNSSSVTKLHCFIQFLLFLTDGNLVFSFYSVVIHYLIALILYSLLIENSEQLLEEFKKQPCHLERLYGRNDMLILVFHVESKDAIVVAVTSELHHVQ